MKNLIFIGSIFNFGQSIIDGIAKFFYTILLWLNCIIYSFISYIYNIFLILANGGEIFDSSSISSLVNRIYIIIGVVILFLVAYSLLRSLVNPDEALKNKKSPVKIIKDVIISIVLIAFVPIIFDFAFEFQNSLLINNTIGKIMAGASDSGANYEETIRLGGYNMAAGVWKTFIQPADGYCSIEQEDDHEANNCEVIYLSDGTTSFKDAWDNAQESTTFFELMGLIDPILEGKISYIFIVDAIAGVFVLFVLLSYCLDMALRLVKLAVYELIAPLPILARILPNDQGNKIFSNWVKATLSTFFEVFIRIAILYFAVMIIALVPKSLDNLFTGGAFATTNTLPLTRLIAQALIIVGIIMFVKQAPNILKEITGVDGSKYNVLKSAKQGFSLLAGGVAGGNPLAAWRAYNQAGEAKLGDFSGIGNQYKRKISAQEARELQEQAGVKGWSRVKANLSNGVRRTFGFGSSKEEADRNLEKFKNLDGTQMTAINDSGMKIIDANGKEIANGATIELTPQNVNGLNAKKAQNELVKSQIAEQVRKYSDVTEGNGRVIAFKSDMEAIAKKEFDKGTFYLTDASGQNLELSYTDSQGNRVAFGSQGATKRELEAWLEANRERMSADEYTIASAALDKSINDWSIRAFVDTNGEFVDRNGQTHFNEDIKAKKREFVQQYLKGHIFEIGPDGEIRQNEDMTAAIQAMEGQEEKVDWELVSDTKKKAESINRNINIKISEQKIEQGRYDSENSAIDGILNQGKQQVEAERASAAYKAREASDKAHDITQQGKK